MTAEQWLARVLAATSHEFPQAEILPTIVRETRVKVRVVLAADTNADLFFREETGRMDYTLIMGRQRRFGLDNLGGWHEHPLENPDDHVPIDKPTPEVAIRRLREANDYLTGGGNVSSDES